MKKLFSIVLVLLSWGPVHANPLQEPLLEAEKAFALSVNVPDPDTLEVVWKIADGYYLYRHKFSFTLLQGNVALQAPLIPAGKKKQDEFFGEVETYTKLVRIQLPLQRLDARAGKLVLQVGAQGCNEPVGVCYPPMTREITVNLPAKATPSKDGSLGNISSGGADLAQLIQGTGRSSSLLGTAAAQNTFLSPDEAFLLQAIVMDDKTILARFQIMPGHYLYRDKTHFQSTGSGEVTLADYKLPPGEPKDDPYIGNTQVYYNQVEIRLPLEQRATGQAAVDIAVTYQGCAEKGICYPPTTKTIHDFLPPTGTMTTVGLPLQIAAAEPLVHQRTIPTTYLWAMLVAFGTGLLLTFTPCVLPMIPILSSVIVGQGGKNISQLKGGLLSASYVLGTAVTYTLAGIIAGASGDQLQANFQNPYAIGLFSAMCVGLALSMFGFYELQMPAFIQSHLHHKTRSLEGGTLAGTFLLGLFSALIVGACVSPLLISILGLAISSQDPVLGGLIMLSLSLGMGVVLIGIGVGAGFLLPQAGPWMNQVKHVFGVLLLAVAIYLLGNLPEVPVLLLWGTLFIICGVYLGALQSLPAQTSGWGYLWKGLGVVLVVWGILALIGGFSGERNILQPLPQRLSATTQTVMATPVGNGFQHVTRLSELEAKLAEARQAGRPVIVDYYADWCVDCVRMEKGTLAQAPVRAELARFLLIKADVTDNNAEARALKQQFDVYGPPTMLFFGKDGTEKRHLRFSGYRNADEFLALLTQL